MGRSMRMGLSIALFVATMTGLSGPVAASGPGNTQIAGAGTFDESLCTEVQDEFTILMTGSLRGCWYTTVLEIVQQTPSGVYQERGEELFIGCLVDGATTTCGSFTTTYKFTAKYQTDPPFAEIHGRCEHPIVGGDGGFSGATGRVDFKDDVVSGEFVYRGHIKLG
jgi:hypothetical protein